MLEIDSRYNLAMNKKIASKNITQHFPDLIITNIKKIGEGLGNVAFEVNENLIFRFPKNESSHYQLGKEISIQEVLKEYSTLPVPEFIYLPSDHSFVGYKKLKGVSLLYLYQNFNTWDSFSKQIGNFLSELHFIPDDYLVKLNLLVQGKSIVDWQNDYYTFYEKTKFVIPEQYFDKIEKFFHSQPPQNAIELALCHNDLGIEHIFMTEDRVTGVIDWGGNVLADPANDFARIYRDLGEKVLDQVLSNYYNSKLDIKRVRERAIFYGKCLLFEDLFYGTEQKEYKEKCLSALGWMFP